MLGAGTQHTSFQSLSPAIIAVIAPENTSASNQPCPPLGTSSFPLFLPRPGIYILQELPGQPRKATTEILTGTSILKPLLLPALAPSAPGRPQQRPRLQRSGRPRRKPRERKQKGKKWRRPRAAPTPRIKNKKDSSRLLRQRLRRQWSRQVS
jgi:hypothetical protein